MNNPFEGLLSFKEATENQTDSEKSEFDPVQNGRICKVSVQNV